MLKNCSQPRKMPDIVAMCNSYRTFIKIPFKI